MTEFEIRRLNARDAPSIVACFRRAYGDSYGNPLFYDIGRLVTAMESKTLCCVGAYDGGGVLRGHMAMSRIPGAGCAELGNTVVDPAARGAGIAWRIGAALTEWCKACGYWGFLHYPTTDHHIMQRQSIKSGFETGLMLGYIPGETDGQVKSRSSHLRQAATIVFEPLASAPALAGYLPAGQIEQINELNMPIGLPRTWRTGAAPRSGSSDVQISLFERRALARMTVRTAGTNIRELVTDFAAELLPCLQIDLLVSDPGIGHVYATACERGFQFCGWLPGFTETDVLRLQKTDPAVTDLAPNVVNPTAQALLEKLS